MINVLQRGFTLMEVMIVVGIIGILAAISYPTYTEYVAKSNRSEPQRELLRMANLMEQYYLDNRTYTQDMTHLGALADPYETESKNYDIDSTDADADGFTLKATVKGHQATVDSVCTYLTVDHTGKKSGSSTKCWEQ